MEAVSQKFEQEAGVSEVLQKHVEQGDSCLLPNVFRCTEEDKYSPYCNIKFEDSPEIEEQAQQHSKGLDCISKKECINYDAQSRPVAGSTISSSLDLDENPLHNDGYVNSNKVEFTKTKCCDRTPVGAHGSAEFVLLSNKCTKEVGSQNTLVPQDDDDSDSEIFRVKRRPSATGEKRIVDDIINLKCPEQQVLKRLKKLHSQGSSDCLVSALNNSSGGAIGQAAIKMRRHSLDAKVVKDDGAMKFELRERNRKDGPPVGLSESIRESPSIELGPKHLKVRGPTFPKDIFEQGS